MIQIRRSALVRQTAERMFDLVNDVEAYPRRFGWCSAARVLERDGDTLVARLDLRMAGITQAFTTRNTVTRPERIHLAFVDGPFRSLEGEWTFLGFGDEGCKVALALDFDYAGTFTAPALRMGFRSLADRMVDDFCTAARQTDG
ncbi:type II toxin-antitoxin system RatA family toxin [Dokdonella sp. MW10]|uniref:type II toxin-antitoxin system RatA family toxin n=1 Tax=Dokdonella sp. MW10 TaxID=2992926 RepID=UPI003F820D67